jgi:FG-GAP-like repeat
MNLGKGSAIRFTVLSLGLALLIAFKPAIYKEPVATGEELAKQYCSSCHLFPEPKVLDKKTWKENVLPNMGWRLGIKQTGKHPLEEMSPDEAALVRKLQVYPSAPLIDVKDWNLIVEYYISKAPDEPLPLPALKPIQLKGFRAQTVFIGEKQAPRTSLVKYDPNTSSLFIGDGQKELYVMGRDLQMKGFWSVESAPVDVVFPKTGSPLLVCIGEFSPSEKRNGRLFALDSVINESTLTIQSLGRPVSLALGDMDDDGTEDIILSEFGNHTGHLSWINGSNLQQHEIKAQAGSRKALPVDLDHDGNMDLITLWAQAREEIVYFRNRGNGRFEEILIKQFPSVYGVSNIELVDFNNDGNMDLLVTNGDNWDLSAIRKNYHGVRILMNDGHQNFNEKYFFPHWGTSKALARDFDIDGDLDIAVAGFYGDYEKPDQSFIYLENKGSFNFLPHAIPDAAIGKWLTMEAADIDKDGDEDIILGSYFHSLSEVTKMLLKGVETFPQVLILWNEHGRKSDSQKIRK